MKFIQTKWPHPQNYYCFKPFYFVHTLKSMEPEIFGVTQQVWSICFAVGSGSKCLRFCVCSGY